jgi:hypothetical protein
MARIKRIKANEIKINNLFNLSRQVVKSSLQSVPYFKIIREH